MTIHIPVDLFYSRANTTSVDKVSQTLRVYQFTIPGEVSKLILMEFIVITMDIYYGIEGISVIY